jgi:hypothetical protein
VDPRRLSLGEWISGSGALLVLVSLSLPWYSVGGTNLTGWQAMSVDDVLITLAALVTLVAVAVDAMPRFAGVSIAALALASMPAVLGLVLVVFRLADPAPAADASLEIGAWLALAGSLGMAGGLAASMRDQGPARRGAERERAAAAAALARAELLSVPGQPGSGETSGGAA